MLSRNYNGVMTTAEITNHLSIGMRTVEGHKRSLLDKTKSRNIVGLIISFLKHGFS